ncbi:MAG: GGDEF domain-containing protein [bacterium]|nr:GGDEF domain-containing protein [bacterium]
MKKSRATTLVFIIMAVIVAVITLSSQSRIKNGNPIDRLGSALDFSEGWYRLDEHKTAHNINISRLDFNGLNTNQMSIYHAIPSSTDNIQRTLAMQTNNVSFSVYLNNDKVYSYGEDLSIFPFNKAPGYAWHFINIPQKTEGGMIRIDIRSHFNDNREGISNVFFGKSAVILKHLIAYQAIPFFLCTLLMLIGFVYMFAHILFNKILKIRVHLFYIGMFSFLGALYSLSHLPIPAFFMTSTHVLNIFERMMLMLLPYALLMHIERVYNPPHKKLFFSAYAVTAANITLQALLCSFTPISLHSMQPAAHLVILYTFLIILYTLYRNCKSNKDADLEPYVLQNNRLFFLCFVLFSIISIINIVRAYFIPLYDSSNLFRLALLILVLCCGVISVREIIEFSKHMAVSDMVRKLAYTDPLTGLANRSSFESAMDKADSDKNHYKTIGIIVFDVNSLKHVNDTFGHQQGDILIKSAADAIKSTFNDDFVTFRIGGDEFAAIYTGDEATSYIDKKIDSFRNNIADNNLKIHTHLHLSVAVGAAFLSASKTESLTDVFRRADRIMYENKKEMKSIR